VAENGKFTFDFLQLTMLLGPVAAFVLPLLMTGLLGGFDDFQLVNKPVTFLLSSVTRHSGRDVLSFRYVFICPKKMESVARSLEPNLANGVGPSSVERDREAHHRAARGVVEVGAVL